MVRIDGFTANVVSYKKYDVAVFEPTYFMDWAGISGEYIL
jgi:hypothetical protein